MQAFYTARVVPPRSTARGDEPTQTVLRESTRGPLPARVTVSGARATPSSLRLERGGCVIGAGPQSDIIIEDASVSRSHAALELVPEGVQLRDLGSRNGTYYLGQRVESMT